MIWCPSHKFDPPAVDIYNRHYSARQYADGRIRRQFAPPGEPMILLAPDRTALFGWIKNRMERYDHQVGVSCFVFRNEGSQLSSELIREADRLAWERWPDRRHFTYVDPKKVRGGNPGYCFKQAGWDHQRDADGKPMYSKKGLVILEIATADPWSMPLTPRQPIACESTLQLALF